MRASLGAGLSSAGFCRGAAPDDRALGVVDFSIFPHLDAFLTNTMAAAERWAAEVGVPAYTIDEQTAIKVIDGTAEILSEGNWKLFNRA